MSISRSMFLAAIAVSLATTAVQAGDLAASVAAKMKESSVLKGYRVNVKAKAGTVWLDGTVSDAGQIDAAIAAAEEVPGVERVVNRLTATPHPASSDAFALPASIRSLVGLSAQAEVPPAKVAASGSATESRSPVEDPSSAEQVVLVDREGEGDAAATGGEAPEIEVTQAVRQSEDARPAPAAQPVRHERQRTPRPLGAQVAKPVPQSRQARQPAARVQRTAMMKNQIPGQPLELPGPTDGYVVGEGPAIGGAPADGQMVPGSMRYTEGPGGGYCPPGQGSLGGGGMGGRGMGGGPMPMGGGGMGGPGGGVGMGGPGGMPVPVRGDGPNMPNYAWPSYAAYPNYAALQYPTQYSPTAWPYIGPFYPYPQVPLGWRRVSLEWDDGWWWLDFDERHIHSHHR